MSLSRHMLVKTQAEELFKKRKDFPLPAFIQEWKNGKHLEFDAALIIQLVHSYSNLLHKLPGKEFLEIAL